jgi:hypothetical protein
MQQRGDDVRALEIRTLAIEVDEAAGGKPPVLVEGEPDAPALLGDRLVAVPALGLARGSPLRAGDPRKARVRCRSRLP